MRYLNMAAEFANKANTLRQSKTTSGVSSIEAFPAVEQNNSNPRQIVLGSP
jgi:hypothetical protein